ncbi:MAG: hypothetical protein IIC78_06215 [Chloroflexi bacterium]|nr:hypothetical protein [Chloroflexota bacterium]
MQTILGDQFYDFYLYSSPTNGDFDAYRSDVDFAVVIQSKLPVEVIDDLDVMHRSLAASDNMWAQKLEGAYLPRKKLRHHVRNDRPVPIINEGRF